MGSCNTTSSISPSHNVTWTDTGCGIEVLVFFSTFSSVAMERRFLSSMFGKLSPGFAVFVGRFFRGLSEFFTEQLVDS